MRGNALSKTVKELALMKAMLMTFIENNTASTTASGGLVQRARQSGTVISVVVIGVVAMVGVLIFAQVEQAMPELEESNPLSDSVTSITEGFGSAIEFVPIILLVLLASVVIAVVQRMRT